MLSPLNDFHKPSFYDCSVPSKQQLNKGPARDGARRFATTLLANTRVTYGAPETFAEKSRSTRPL